ncbi:MAG TPA: YaaA family protein [Candidatus Saccharimonadales bacterium]|nr:YaaA family protein [Candidatus Saccharimonadales bacterium]
MNQGGRITILIHSSKTMRLPTTDFSVRQPVFIDKAKQLSSYLQTLSQDDIARSMHVSSSLAQATHSLIEAWLLSAAPKGAAMDSFIGDIYSGLRGSELSIGQRKYADKTLIILSGLYGVLRPLDSVRPYRLEMGYRFPNSSFKTMYKFWGSDIVEYLPKTGPIVNVSSAEYMRVITPFVDSERIITPKFLTLDTKTNRPIFTAVHAKIARGAFARWMIINEISNTKDFIKFNDLGYEYRPDLSSKDQPVFVCKEFGGKGLSIRTKAI